MRDPNRTAHPVAPMVPSPIAPKPKNTPSDVGQPAADLQRKVILGILKKGGSAVLAKFVVAAVRVAVEWLIQ